MGLMAVPVISLSNTVGTAFIEMLLRAYKGADNYEMVFIAALF